MRYDTDVLLPQGEELKEMDKKIAVLPRRN